LVDGADRSSSFQIFVDVREMSRSKARAINFGGVLVNYWLWDAYWYIE
jgi:hypothetical protein